MLLRTLWPSEVSAGPSQMSINEKSNDLVSIDSILELIELKVNDIKKEFTSKMSDLSLTFINYSSI